MLVPTSLCILNLLKSNGVFIEIFIVFNDEFLFQCLNLSNSLIWLAHLLHGLLRLIYLSNWKIIIFEFYLIFIECWITLTIVEFLSFWLIFFINLIFAWNTTYLFLFFLYLYIFSLNSLLFLIRFFVCLFFLLFLHSLLMLLLILSLSLIFINPFLSYRFILLGLCFFLFLAYFLILKSIWVRFLVFLIIYISRLRGNILVSLSSTFIIMWVLVLMLLTWFFYLWGYNLTEYIFWRTSEVNKDDQKENDDWD
jgi:hypothetical protein